MQFIALTIHDARRDEEFFIYLTIVSTVSISSLNLAELRAFQVHLFRRLK